MKEKIYPTFYDNVCVKKGRNDNEYLAIALCKDEDSPKYDVSVRRYCVPGRCDTYNFWWDKSDHPRNLSYFSDGWQSLPKSLEMVKKDFDLPQVVDMMTNAFNAERIVMTYRLDFLQMMSVLAPKSKAYHKVKSICDKTYAERVARFAAEKSVKVIPIVT